MGILILCSLLMQIALGWIAARTWLVKHNSLQANGRWSSTKTELSRGVLGAYAYVTEPQALARGWLNLGSWHGFNEVMYKRPIAGPARLEFAFELERGAYLVAIVGRDEEGNSAGLRLSRAPSYRNAFVEFDAAGRFLRRQDLALPELDSNAVRQATIEIEPQRLVARVDGVAAGEFPYVLPASYRFGFRGGLHDALVDDVRLTPATGDSLREEFDTPAAAAWVLAAVVGALLVANLLILSRAGGPAPTSRSSAFAISWSARRCS